MMNSLTAQRMGIKERKVSIVRSPIERKEEGWAVVGMRVEGCALVGVGAGLGVVWCVVL